MHRPCRRRAPPVPIGRCVRPCSLCRCCCSRCRGIPARAGRPVSATMGRANSVTGRGSSIRKRKSRRQALRNRLSTSKPLWRSELDSRFGRRSCESWCDRLRIAGRIVKLSLCFATCESPAAYSFSLSVAGSQRYGCGAILSSTAVGRTTPTRHSCPYAG